MKLAVDVMGFENDVKEAIEACRAFREKHDDVKIILFGDQNKIKPHLKSIYEFEIVHTDVFVTQEDTVLSARRKANSSMQLAANYLSMKKVDGLLSAGNTSVFVMTMYSTIGLLDFVSRPGFMPTIPTIDGSFFNMIDVGANLEVNTLDLVRFATMANVYAKQFKPHPTIGVLNIGTEPHKGPTYLHDANDFLSKSRFNYVGYVESKNLLERVADIVVTDGYSGNLVLKACEGTVKSIAKLIKDNIKMAKNVVPLLFAGNFLKKTFNKFDYKNYAGAFVLGLKEVVVKTHGSADKEQFASSLRMLYECISNNVIKQIQSELTLIDKEWNKWKAS